MLIVNKKFVIKNTDFVPDGTGQHFVGNFYRLMIESGALVNHFVSHEDYHEAMSTFKQPYKTSGEIIHNQLSYIDSTTYEWVGIFESAEVYEEYKNSLISVFNTDFNSSIDNDSITLVVSQE
jgi:hypothetical protein